MHLFPPESRPVHILTDVARDQALTHRLFERPVQDGVSVLDGTRREAYIEQQLICYLW